MLSPVHRHDCNYSIFHHIAFSILVSSLQLDESVVYLPLFTNSDCVSDIKCAKSIVNCMHAKRTHPSPTHVAVFGTKRPRANFKWSKDVMFSCRTWDPLKKKISTMDCSLLNAEFRNEIDRLIHAYPFPVIAFESSHPT